MKILKALFLWLTIAMLFSACAVSPPRTGTPGETTEASLSESNTTVESETDSGSKPEEAGTGSEGMTQFGEEDVKALYESLGITVREIRRAGGRFLAWTDSLSVEEGYEPSSVFEILDPVSVERTFLLETDGPAVDIDVRTHEDGTISLMALQQDFYGDRARGRNGEVVSAAERVTANGLRTVERYKEPFLYPLGCPFTVGSVLEEEYLKEVELKNIRISTDGNPYLYIAFGWKGKDGESGPIPAAEVSGEKGEIRVFFPGIGLKTALAGEHEVKTAEDDFACLTSWKAEKIADGVLLTVRTGEVIARVACHAIEVRDGSELCLQLENPGNSYPVFTYQDR